jgi:hypothetical protein
MFQGFVLQRVWASRLRRPPRFKDLKPCCAVWKLALSPRRKNPQLHAEPLRALRDHQWRAGVGAGLVAAA